MKSEDAQEHDKWRKPANPCVTGGNGRKTIVVACCQFQSILMLACVWQSTLGVFLVCPNLTDTSPGKLGDYIGDDITIDDIAIDDTTIDDITIDDITIDDITIDDITERF